LLLFLVPAIWVQAAGYVLFPTVAPARPPAHQGDTLAWPLVWCTGVRVGPPAGRWPPRPGWQTRVPT